jgi:integrase
MARVTRKRIGLKDLQAIQPGETLYDATIKGFCARRQKGDQITFLVRYRTAEGRDRHYKIGPWGPLTPDQAREQARQILADAAKGQDPAKDRAERRVAPTVSELCGEYMKAAEAGRLLTRSRRAKRPSTIASDKSRVESHIKPLLGAMKVASVTSRDIDKFLNDVTAGRSAKRQKGAKPRVLHNVRGGQGAASRTVGLLGAIFTYAVRLGWRPDNPVAGVQRPADGKKARRLSDEEYAALGKALRTASPEDYWPPAIHATRFLALTGWRSGEALGLKRADVDFGKRLAVLVQTKSGESVRHLSTQAIEALKEAAKLKLGDSDLFFPSSKASVMSGFPGHFEKLLTCAEIDKGITPHTLRHSFGSVAGDLGLAEFTISALLGHSTHSVTAGYVHRADAALLAYADQVAGSIAERMGDKAPAQGAEIIQLHVGATA